ncbi:MAG TPA: FkbM family methyltransferase [Vicinamibacterales bacterium]|nr:FkbM family methyltransferase [Vicinamibacterales bacterium]
MSTFVGARWMRRYLAPWLPERMKTGMRARLFGYRPSESATLISCGSDDRGRFADIDGLRVRYRDDDRSDFEYHLVHNGESIEELTAFVRAARAARLVVDVGAWKGLFSIVFCHLGGTRTAVAYEPSPVGIAAIGALADLNDCATAITIRPVAVGEHAGTALTQVASDGIMSVDAAAAPETAQSVAVVALDDDLERLSVAPDLIKIDVEGYEYEVLRGARRTIARHHPTVFLELHLDLLERRGRAAADVVDELYGAGYRFSTVNGEPLTRRQLIQSPHAVRRVVAAVTP